MCIGLFPTITLPNLTAPSTESERLIRLIRLSGSSQNGYELAACLDLVTLHLTSITTCAKLRGCENRTMLPTEHYLSQVVDKALHAIQQRSQYFWEDNYITAKLSDPFQKHLASDLGTDYCINEINSDVGRSTNVADPVRSN